MQLHSSKTTNWVFFLNAWNCLFKWWNLVRLRRIWLLRNRSIYCVGQGEHSRGLGTAYVWYSLSHRIFSAMRQKGGLLHLLKQTVSTNILRPVRLCRGELNICNWNLVQEGGTSLQCRRRLTVSIMTFLLVGSTWPIVQAARFSSIWDTFYPIIDVKSIYLFDTRRDLPDQVMEGEQGWVMQGVLSRASFRRPPVSCQITFTVLSLHISNIYAKKTGTAKKLILTLRAIMVSQEFDLVVDDFNGTAWRCRSRDNLSTIDEAFTDCASPAPPGIPPLWGPVSIPGNWADACGFLKPPGSQRFWKVNVHGAFSIPRSTLGLRLTDESCHHETWLHLNFVDWSNTWSKQGDHDRHISLKERLGACSYGNQKRRISEVMSDHSLQSWTCNHLHIHVSFDMTLTLSRSDSHHEHHVRLF